MEDQIELLDCGLDFKCQGCGGIFSELDISIVEVSEDLTVLLCEGCFDDLTMEDEDEDDYDEYDED